MKPFFPKVFDVVVVSQQNKMNQDINYEHEVEEKELFQRTRIQFSEPIWWLTRTCINTNPRDSDFLFLITYVVYGHTCRQNSHAFKINKYISMF